MTQAIQFVSQDTQDKLCCSIKTSVQVNGSDDGLKGIRQCRITFTPATCFLAATHNEVSSEPDLSCETGEGLGAD